jgi:CPA1 family monovalent cation:H+ antiporter
MLAFGLVAATTGVAASVAHVIIPEMPWAAAFVLGAVVSPTDELAAIPVLRSLRLPRHAIAIVEGESLFNDAAALVVYAAALAALAGGGFRLDQTLLRCVLSSIAAIGIGLLAGRLTIELWRGFTDVELQGCSSVTTLRRCSLMAPRFDETLGSDRSTCILQKATSHRCSSGEPHVVRQPADSK